MGGPEWREREGEREEGEGRVGRDERMAAAERVARVDMVWGFGEWRGEFLESSFCGEEVATIDPRAEEEGRRGWRG